VSCGLQDEINLERLGVPALLVHTDAFAEAAIRQAEMHGQPELRRASVPHPLQDKTADQIRQLAREAVTRILSKLTA
jgi:butyrate kinase